MPLYLWVGLLVALILLVVGLVVTLTSQRSLVDERLESYLQQGKEVTQAVTEEKPKTSFLSNWITSRVETTSFGERISRDLARADLKFKSGEYVILVILSSLLTGVFGYFFGGGSWIFAIGGAIFGLYIPRFFVRFQQGKRLNKFNDQLPDMLNLMVNGLRTGFSALQAMEAVAKELPSPISDEFRRVVQEMSLGVPMEGALENLERRIASDDLDLAITAINIQREVGGNLAEILETISYTIRERLRIHGEVRAVTAQVSYSGKFLALMPIILSVVLWGLNREYMMQFFQEPILCGGAMLCGAAVLLVVGYFTLNRLGKVEI